MTEPTSAAAAAVAGSVITVAGVATGLPADLLLPSFAGALWALRGLEQGGIAPRVAQVAAGTLLAAWSTPAVSILAAASVGVDASALRFPFAALIGWGGIGLMLPRVARWMRGEKP